MTYPPRPRRRARAALSLAAASLAVALPIVRASAADPEPTPTGLQAVPGATRDDVVRALRKVRRKYGADAVVIETQLLLNAMRNGAQRATAVRVDGVQPHRDKRYLCFDVETGLVFDSATRDERARVQMLWRTIMVPTLERLGVLALPADGLKVAMHYHHRPYRSQNELRAALDQPGTAEETTFYLLGHDLDAVAHRDLAAQDLITRALVTVDAEERAIAAFDREAPDAPGPE